MTRKVTITYTDNNSLTDSEIVKSCQQTYGENTEVVITPNDDNYIYFGIQRLITEDQVRLFFDEGEHVYRETLPILRTSVLNQLEETLNQVIIDNEEGII